MSQEEVAHFNELAADWWSPHGSSRLLHLMNPLRHDFIASCLATTQDGASSLSETPAKLRYLDVGCGGGIFAESAARLPRTSSVLGIDPTPGVLAVARSHAQKDPLIHNTGRLQYKQASIEDLATPESTAEQFDVLSMFEVIEHVHRPSKFLERCLPFVKPGGWLVGSTIARTTMSWFTTKLMAEDVLRIVPQGTHDWDKYLNEEELRDWFRKRDGWEQFTSQGVAYVPVFGWKIIPGGEKIGNYFFAARKRPDAS